MKVNKRPEMGTAKNWSDLPEDMLASISKCLQDRVSILGFRSVCRSWRASTPPFRQSPATSSRLPFPIASKDPKRISTGDYYALLESTVYRLEPLCPTPSNQPCFLIKVDEPTPGALHLLNPLSQEYIDPLPRAFPRLLNVMDFRVTEIGKAYRLPYFSERWMGFLHQDEYMAVSVAKVAISSKPVSRDDDSYSVVAINKAGHLFSTVLGRERWHIYEGGEDFIYEDVLNFKSKFYVIDQMGRVLVIHEASLEIIEVIVPADCDIGPAKRLVEAYGDLFFVHRNLDAYSGTLNPYAPKEMQVTREMVADFEVFRLNQEARVWEKTSNLGDRALFLAQDGCYSISTADFPGCKTNCIYFYDDSTTFYIKDYNDDDSVRGLGSTVIGVFNMEDGKGGPLSSYPGYAKIFWPPPAWLRPDQGSSHGRK